VGQPSHAAYPRGGSAAATRSGGGLGGGPIDHQWAPSDDLGQDDLAEHAGPGGPRRGRQVPCSAEQGFVGQNRERDGFLRVRIHPQLGE